jgi:hypothetical protein
MFLISLYVVGRLGDWLLNNVVCKLEYKGCLMLINVLLGEGNLQCNLTKLINKIDRNDRHSETKQTHGQRGTKPPL